MEFNVASWKRGVPSTVAKTIHYTLFNIRNFAAIVNKTEESDN